MAPNREHTHNLVSTRACAGKPPSPGVAHLLWEHSCQAVTQFWCGMREAMQSGDCVRGLPPSSRGPGASQQRHRHTHGFCLPPARAAPGYGVSQPKQHKDRPDRPQRNPGSQSPAELLLSSDPEAPSLVYPPINRDSSPVPHLPPPPRDGEFSSLAATQLLAQEEPHPSMSSRSGVSFPPLLARLLGNPDSGVFFHVEQRMEERPSSFV